MIWLRCDTCGERLETGEPFTTFGRLHECAIEAGWDLTMAVAPQGAHAPRVTFSRCDECVDGGVTEPIGRAVMELMIAEAQNIPGEPDYRPDLEMGTGWCPRCGAEMQTMVPLEGDDELRDGFDGWAADLCAECIINDVARAHPEPADLAAGLLALVLVTLTGAPRHAQVPVRRRGSRLQAVLAHAWAHNLA